MKKRMNVRYLLMLIIIILGLVIIYSPEIADSGAGIQRMFSKRIEIPAAENQEALKAKLRKKNENLELSLRNLSPASPYMIINTTENRFSLHHKGEVIREGFCSTGSLIKLQADDNRYWIFKTPRGRLTIQSKLTSPVWVKPDWVFVEEGLPIPPQNHPSRYESGVLGDYALSLGQGYLIHGTLYQRLLGMPVTHGCIRLGDADLKVVYENLRVGSKVFIF